MPDSAHDTKDIAVVFVPARSPASCKNVNGSSPNCCSNSSGSRRAEIRIEREAIFRRQRAGGDAPKMGIPKACPGSIGNAIGLRSCVKIANYSERAVRRNGIFELRCKAATIVIHLQHEVAIAAGHLRNRNPGGKRMTESPLSVPPSGTHGCRDRDLDCCKGAAGA